MFGYVKPWMPRLMVCECDYYKSIYCGLCRSMGKNIGQGHRLCLSYDFAFLCLVRMAILGHSFSLKKKRCFLHPFKKRLMMQPNESLEYCAMLSAILTYHNIQDDIRDSRGFRKLLAWCLLPFASHYRRRAGKFHALEAVIVQQLDELCLLEKQNASPDACADTFGKLMEEICVFQIEDEEKRRIAKAIGFHVGRFVYLCDAADDYEKDRKRGAFNPFARDNKEAELSAEEKQRIETALIYEALAVDRAANLLGVEHELQRGILENVVRLGMPQTAKRVLNLLHNECEIIEE